MTENTQFSETLRTIAEEAATGARLDAYLAKQFTEYSRNRIKDFILAGTVRVNGQTISEPRHKIKPGDTLELYAPPPVDAAPQPEPIALDILHEDADLIVLNKPAGLVVHPAPGNSSGTLVNALLHHCKGDLPGIGGERRPGIVHRLDKDTSGVMVAAKTDRAMKRLAAQFADHGRTGPLERAYTAFVWGTPGAPTGTVDAPIGRDGANRLRQAVRASGRNALTHYAVTRRFAGEGWEVSRLTCRLETGRTHQIRVHMAHIGFPLIADPLYASGFATKANRLPEPLQSLVRNLGRQALHASLLAFEHPTTREPMRFETHLPSDLEELETALAPYDRVKAGR